jgi:hypothetical protein
MNDVRINVMTIWKKSTGIWRPTVQFNTAVGRLKIWPFMEKLKKVLSTFWNLKVKFYKGKLATIYGQYYYWYLLSVLNINILFLGGSPPYFTVNCENSRLFCHVINFRSLKHTWQSCQTLFWIDKNLIINK